VEIRTQYKGGKERRSEPNTRQGKGGDQNLTQGREREEIRTQHKGGKGRRSEPNTREGKSGDQNPIQEREREEIVRV